MILVLLLVVVFGGIALITFVDNTTRAGRRARAMQEPRRGALAAAQPAADVPTQATGEDTAALILRLPEPLRARAWALLCRVADAQAHMQNAGNGDARTAYLLAQTRGAYLPDTLRAYLNLTAGARAALTRQGQPPEVLLAEQLALLEDGAAQAARHDHAAADRLLTQGRFLRERFGPEGGELRLKG